MDLSSSECLGVQDMHHHSMACLKALHVVAAFVTCTACPKASACQGMELNVGSLGPAQCTAHSSLQVIFKLVKSTAAMMAHILMALEKVFPSAFLVALVPEIPRDRNQGICDWPMCIPCAASLLRSKMFFHPS